MPRPSPSKEYVLQTFILNKSIIIDHIDESSVFNANTAIFVKCNTNNVHVYQTTISKLKTGRQDITICPHCTKEKKDSSRGIPSSVITEFADRNNLYFFPKKESYQRDVDQIKFTCKLCNKFEFEHKSLELWEPRYDTLTVNCKECTVIEKTKLNVILKQKMQESIIKTIDKIEKYELIKPIIVENLSAKFKEKLDNSKWSVLKYENTKNKGSFQCQVCGYINECLPFNLFNGNAACEGCYRKDQKIKIINKIERICKENKIIILNDVIDYKDLTTEFDCQCEECQFNFIGSYKIMCSQTQSLSCPNCAPNRKRTQLQIFEWTKTLLPNTEVISEYKLNGVELDIFVPSLKFAIEYCGVLYHSNKYDGDTEKATTRHEKKWQLCKDNGINLITLFEDEWMDKREICESRIKGFLGVTACKIGARELDVKEVEPLVANTFFENNHIQGVGKTTIAYGLYKEDVLISCMSFSNPSIARGSPDETYDWELNRFCSLIDHSVPGSASRLLQPFKIREHGKKLITFNNLRWGMGKVYESIGFTYVGKSRPNYYYVGASTDWQRKHRFGFTKHKLLEMFPNSDVNKSETVIAFENGLYKIYDCGNTKYEMMM